MVIATCSKRYSSSPGGCGNLAMLGRVGESSLCPETPLAIVSLLPGDQAPTLQRLTPCRRADVLVGANDGDPFTVDCTVRAKTPGIADSKTRPRTSASEAGRARC